MAVLAVLAAAAALVEGAKAKGEGAAPTGAAVKVAGTGATEVTKAEAAVATVATVAARAMVVAVRVGADTMIPSRTDSSFHLHTRSDRSLQPPASSHPCMGWPRSRA